MGGCAFRSKGGTGQAPTTAFLPPIPNRMNMISDQQFGSSVVGFDSNPFLPNSFNVLNFLNLWFPYNTAMDGGASVNTVSFGGFTTAPDGTTNTAQLMVESTSNSYHFATGALGSNTPSVIGVGGTTNNWNLGTIRLAGFFKSTNRNVVLELSNFRNPASANSGGAQACFNLQNGTIVFSGSFGSELEPNESYTKINAQIFPFANGFYLCWLDVFVGIATVGAGPNRVAVYIDNGTATLGNQPSYTGDGISGVYGWLTNALPARAWGITGTSFFDGFDDNTMAQIDGVQNANPTYKPGFNWYNNGLLYPSTDFRNFSHASSQNPSFSVPPVPSRGYGGFGPTYNIVPAPPSWFANSNSILTLQVGVPLVPPAGVTDAFWDGIASVAWNGQGSIPGATLPAQVLSGGNSVGGAGDPGSGPVPTFPSAAVGNTWVPPFYKETRAAYIRGGETAFWTRPAETLFDPFGTTFNDPLCFVTAPQIEIDYFDDINTFQTSFAFGGHDQNFRFPFNWFGNMTNGVPDYAAITVYDPGPINYGPDSAVYHYGTNQFYNNHASFSGGAAPPNSPWSTYIYAPPTATRWPPIPKAAHIGSDFDGGGSSKATTFNVYGFLLMPQTPTEPGQFLTAFNGMVTNQITYHTTLQQDLGGNFGNTIAHNWIDGKHFPIFLGSGPAETSYDYVLVMQ